MKRRNRGQILVLFTLSLVVLIGMAALGVDVGYMYSVRHDLQRCADAGALAGASRFINAPGETGTWADAAVQAEATARAIEYASKDNVIQTPLMTQPGDNIIVTFPGQDNVMVQTERTVPLFFSRLFLGPTKRITAYAVAEAAWTSEHVKCPAPFGVPLPWIENFYGPGGDPYKYDPGIDCVVSLDRYPSVPEDDPSHPCYPYRNDSPTQWSYITHDNVIARSGRDGLLCKSTLLNLKIGEPGKTQEPGHFYPLDLSDEITPGSCPPGVTVNSGAAFYKYMIKNRNCESGCQTDINLGAPIDPLDIKPGNMVGPTIQAVAPTYYKDIGFIGTNPDPDSLMNGAPSGPNGPPNYSYLNYTATNYNRGWADWNWDPGNNTNSPLAEITPYRYLEVPFYDPSNPPEPGKSMIQPVAFVGIWIQDISENQGTIVARIVELKGSGTSTDPGGGARRTQVIHLVE